MISDPSCTYSGRRAPRLPHPASAIANVSGVARSMIGMYWMNARTQIIAQEPIHLPAVIAVDGVDRGQDVPVDPVPLEHLQPAHHPVERRLAALVHPVRVVHLLRAVDGDPDQEVVLLEERPHSSLSSVPLVCIVFRIR